MIFSETQTIRKEPESMHPRRFFYKGAVSDFGKMRGLRTREGRYMEEIPEAIADIAKRTGTTEDEARLLFCLEHTGEAFDALPNVTTGERIQVAVQHGGVGKMVAAGGVGGDQAEGGGGGGGPGDAGCEPW